jgi:hypothetical protein
MDLAAFEICDRASHWAHAQGGHIQAGSSHATAAAVAQRNNGASYGGNGQSTQYAGERAPGPPAQKRNSERPATAPAHGQARPAWGANTAAAAPAPAASRPHKTLRYDKPWQKHMKPPRHAPQQAAQPDKGRVGAYARPWRDKNVLPPRQYAPPAAHSVKVPAQTQRRVQVRATMRSYLAPCLVVLSEAGCSTGVVLARTAD